MKRKTKEIRDFILDRVEASSNDLSREVVDKFGITRQAVSKNIRTLMSEGLIYYEGTTKNRQYFLKTLSKIRLSIDISDKSEENQIWVQKVAPHLNDLKENVRGICHHGFTEMMNNVIDHSGSPKADILVKQTARTIEMTIRDYGVGIWRNLQNKLQLSDARHAILELAKGKLTTDSENHTGEGIFFTSRMFDRFLLESDDLSFCCFQDIEGEMLFDTQKKQRIDGTLVFMSIGLDSEKTTRKVFDMFTSEFDDYGFTRTQLAIELAKYEGDHLVSRSQAKRILSRLNEFKEVVLDFRGITQIGQAFSDEIFRVFRNEHPEVLLVPVNKSEEVEKMIKRASSQVSSEL